MPTRTASFDGLTAARPGASVRPARSLALGVLLGLIGALLGPLALSARESADSSSGGELTEAEELAEATIQWLEAARLGRRSRGLAGQRVDRVERLREELAPRVSLSKRPAQARLGELRVRLLRVQLRQAVASDDDPQTA